MRRKAKNKVQTVANRPPVIKSFTTSFEIVVTPCPDWSPKALPCSPNDNHTVMLETKAFDPDGDTLLYKYSVTGGQITGEGACVSWDYTGLSVGSYTAEVSVSDQHGGVSSKSVNLEVKECPACDPPCITITVSCPSDAEERQTVTFTVNVSGGEPYTVPTYNWTISSGTIIEGQGTPEIKVDTSGLAGQQIEATVKIGGFAPECQNEASGVVQVRKKI